MLELQVGARASTMSLMQTAPLLARLALAGPTLLRPYSGAGGDRNANRAALSEAGVFSDEIENALLDGDIDVAVHCLKDAPTHDTAGLTMTTYAARDDIRDCLVTRDGTGTLDSLPPGTTVATASVRRTAAVRAYRPDLTITPIRGPVDERLRALRAPGSGVDALIVASCSMERLGLAHQIAQRLHPEIICPPLGAAIIAFQTREDDTRTRERLAALHDPATAVEAEAERFVLRQMGGYCNAPLAGYCSTRHGTDGTPSYTVRVRSLTPDGTSAVDVRLTGRDATATAAAACLQHQRYARP
ncbi:hydroxymethylbilane synthase [Streptomyces sp. KE1]|uniref:hydroxymethylbilane synthase n=1 Tax=Streptomyces sp. KE1 TaxID=1638939 RepID=UPI00069D3760|nr:hydroxymethylbilane synthase [Streptomyces sp. KE1]